MTTVTNPLDAYSLSTATGKAAAGKEMGQDTFLKLMITQLNNQDPTKPLESNEFLAQLAQFSTVSGIQDLQKSFEAMAGTMQSNQALQAGNLVGHSVLVPADVGYLPAAGAMQGTIELPQSTGSLSLAVYDASGALVRRLDLGAQNAGNVKFAWDGLTDAGQQAAPGGYYLRAEAQYNGQPQAVSTLSVLPVDSVTLDPAYGLILNVAGLGSVAFTDVREIL